MSTSRVDDAVVVLAELHHLAAFAHDFAFTGRRRDIRLSTLEKLAKACGLKLWELLNFETTPFAVGEDPTAETNVKPAKRRRKLKRES